MEVSTSDPVDFTAFDCGGIGGSVDAILEIIVGSCVAAFNKVVDDVEVSDLLIMLELDEGGPRPSFARNINCFSQYC